MTFKEAIVSRGACEEGVEWAGSRSLQDVCDKIPRSSWWLWALGKFAGQDGWPSKDKVLAEVAARLRDLYRTTPPDSAESVTLCNALYEVSIGRPVALGNAAAAVREWRDHHSDEYSDRAWRLYRWYTAEPLLVDGKVAGVDSTVELNQILREADSLIEVRTFRAKVRPSTEAIAREGRP